MIFKIFVVKNSGLAFPFYSWQSSGDNVLFFLFFFAAQSCEFIAEMKLTKSRNMQARNYGGSDKNHFPYQSFILRNCENSLQVKKDIDIASQTLSKNSFYRLKKVF